jgi:hypothetical protein
MNKWDAVLKICIALLCMPSTLYAVRSISPAADYLCRLLSNPQSRKLIIRVLQEEVRKRTDIHLGITDGWSGSPVIALALSSDGLIER